MKILNPTVKEALKGYASVERTVSQGHIKYAQLPDMSYEGRIELFTAAADCIVRAEAAEAGLSEFIKSRYAYRQQNAAEARAKSM